VKLPASGRVLVNFETEVVAFSAQGASCSSLGLIFTQNQLSYGRSCITPAPWPESCYCRSPLGTAGSGAVFLPGAVALRQRRLLLLGPADSQPLPAPGGARAAGACSHLVPCQLRPRSLENQRNQAWLGSGVVGAAA